MDTSLAFLTVEKAAAALGYSKSYIYQLIHRREIPCYKRGAKVLFDPAELDNWVRRGKIATVDEITDRADAVLNRGGRL